MIVYGRNPVRVAIRGPRRVERVWATKNARRLPWLTDPGVPVEVVRAEDLEQRSGTPSHQGVCARVEPFRYADAQQLLDAPNALIVALDQVQDPQNLGSICRTAECAGAAGVVLPERRSATVTAAVCKASAGAVEHLSVAKVRNLVDFLRDAKSAGLWCYGADADAAAPYDSVAYSEGSVLVFGSEGRGLRPRVAAACDLLVSLPLFGRMESLSVTAAAAVLLYAAAAGRPPLDRRP
jgi:23S rRNA (guanosine2251-2'-O)-methyltransferase